MSDNEKIKQKLYDYLQSYKITIPDRIRKSINDVFDENDFVDSDDVMYIYFKNDLEMFESETACANIIYFDISKNRKSSFDIVTKYTYYGKLDFNNSFTEDIKIINDESEIYEVSNIIPTDFNKLENPEDYCIIVLVERIFENGEYSEIPRLYFYVPQEIPENIDENIPVRFENNTNNIENTKNIPVRVENNDISDSWAKFFNKMNS